MGKGFGKGGRKIPEPMELCHKTILNKIINKVKFKKHMMSMMASISGTWKVQHAVLPVNMIISLFISQQVRLF